LIAPRGARLESSSGATVELIGEKLILRSIDERDEELYCGLFCDAETMRYIGPPWTRAEAARAFRSVLEATRRTPPRALFLTLIAQQTQRPIGLCTLQDVDPVRRQTELGVMLLPAARVQGLATEAMIAVIAHAFSTLPVDEVWVRFAVDHAVCERLALRTGLIRHPHALPQDLAAKLWRWSAYRGSWRPAARASDTT
jgi:RimJ/RimL family protein N-acetyltransferase